VGCGEADQDVNDMVTIGEAVWCSGRASTWWSARESSEWIEVGIFYTNEAEGG
jgi:hypothetical protein